MPVGADHRAILESVLGCVLSTPRRGGERLLFAAMWPEHPGVQWSGDKVERALRHFAAGATQRCCKQSTFSPAILTTVCAILTIVWAVQPIHLL